MEFADISKDKVRLNGICYLMAICPLKFNEFFPIRWSLNLLIVQTMPIFILSEKKTPISHHFEFFIATFRRESVYPLDTYYASTGRQITRQFTCISTNARFFLFRLPFIWYLFAKPIQPKTNKLDRLSLNRIYHKILTHPTNTIWVESMSGIVHVVCVVTLIDILPVYTIAN